jgi:hypothetical protein
MEERRHTERPPLVRFPGRAREQLLRSNVVEKLFELGSSDPRRRSQRETHLSIDRPLARAVRGLAKSPPVRPSRAKDRPGSGRSREEVEVELVARRLSKRNAVIVCPHSCVALAVRPVVLTGDGVALKRISAAKRPDRRALYGAPVESTARAGSDARDLASREIAVAATRREEEVNDLRLTHFAQPNGLGAQLSARRQWGLEAPRTRWQTLVYPAQDVQR